MNCPKCGKEMPDGALFCTGCGYRLESPAADTPKTATDDETGLEQTISETAEPAETMLVANDTEQDEEAIEEKTANDNVIGDEGSDASGFEPAVQFTPFAYEAHKTADIPADTPAAVPANDNKSTEANTPYFSVESVDTKKKKSKEVLSSPVKPLSAWSYIWREFVFLIPVVNIIVLFVFAFAEGINRNSRSFARSRLIYALIITLLLIVGAILFFVNLDAVLEPLRGWLVNFAEWIGNLPR